MTGEDQEWQAVKLLEPHLGALTRPLRKLTPSADEEYPGQTFDFVAVRDDGEVIAIEVTGAWNASWIADQSALMRYCEKLTPRLPAAGCKPGNYVLTWYHQAGALPNLRKVPLEDVARLAAQAQSQAEVRTDYGFRIRYLRGNTDRPIAHASVISAEFVDGGPASDRFERAVLDCVPKLRTAGAAGMRTYLVVVHWMLGSSTAWRTALEQIDLDEHPQEIWAVDIGGWQNRQPTERLR